MMFITGPLYSGKRTFARNFRGSVIADVQDAAAETQTPEQLETPHSSTISVVIK